MSFRILSLILAALSLANAAWMLISPETWYTDLPAGVPDTGPYNGHLIRDLGFVFLMIAGGFIWCAIRPAQSWLVLLTITIFFSGHALLHVLDLISNRLPHSHWSIDAPAVFLPALFLIVLTFVRRPRKL